MGGVPGSFQYISDAPISKEKPDQDRFGHIGIASTIVQTISRCPTPYTIGIFGNWGTGKTSIINMIENELEKNDIATVYFDVWKRESDNLRQTFIKDIHSELKRKKLIQKELNERVDTTKTLTVSRKFAPKRIIVMFFLIYFILLLTIGVYIIEYSYENFHFYISYTSSSSLITILVAFFLQNLVTDEKITRTEERFIDPYQFQEEFVSILRDCKKTKLVIFIDNLDRATHGKAIEIITIIKTFLEQEKCIFVIACDVNAIRRHLKRLYIGESSTDSQNNHQSHADEFLRKFFNTSIFIPSFIDVDLQRYTEELLLKTNCRPINHPEIAFTITAAFRNNPRQIKQFINNLLTTYLLILNREEGKNPMIQPIGTVSNYMGFVTLLLIIQQKFPLCYNKIMERQLFPSDIKECIGDPELSKLLDATVSISRPKNIRPFLFLKQSVEELSLPRSSDLEIALYDKNQEGSLEIIREITSDSKMIPTLERFLILKINENEYRTPVLFNIISSLLDTLENLDINFSKRLYNELTKHINAQLKDRIHLFEPAQVIGDLLTKADRSLTKSVIDQYIIILSENTLQTNNYNLDDEQIIEIFSLIVSNIHLFKDYSTEISSVIQNYYFDNDDILLKFSQDEEAQRRFINEETLVGYFSMYDMDNIMDIENFKRFLNMYLMNKRIISPKIISTVLLKIKEFTDQESKIEIDDETHNRFKYYYDILYAIYKSNPQDFDVDILSDIKQNMISNIQRTNNRDVQVTILQSLILLERISKEDEVQEIHDIISPYFGSLSIESIMQLINRMDNEWRLYIYQKYMDEIDERLSEDINLLHIIWNITDENNRISIFELIIDEHEYDIAHKILRNEELLKNLDKSKLLSVVLQYFKDIPQEESIKFLEYFNEIKCANDKEVRRKFGEILQNMIVGINNQDQSRFGYNLLSDATYLSAEVKRGIARSILDWLNSLNDLNMNYEYPLRTCILFWDQLMKSDRERLIHILFVKIILRTNDMTILNFGFSLLNELSIQHEKYPQYFDDTIERIETMDNQQVKEFLQTKLKELGFEGENRSG